MLCFWTFFQKSWKEKDGVRKRQERIPPPLILFLLIVHMIHYQKVDLFGFVGRTWVDYTCNVFTRKKMKICFFSLDVQCCAVPLTTLHVKHEFQVAFSKLPSMNHARKLPNFPVVLQL